MVRKKYCNSESAGGFTLIELMVAITILAIVIGIIFATFSTVVTATQTAREAASDLYAQQFIRRNFTSNLAQVTEGWLPGAQRRASEVSAAADGGILGNTNNAGETEGYEVRYTFIGTDEYGGRRTSMDQLEFISSAPIMSTGGLPGITKRVTYQVITSGDEDDEILEETDAKTVLQITESPEIDLEISDSEDDSALDAIEEGEEDEDMLLVDATWDYPIESMNIQYYDGQTSEWVDEWNSEQSGYLPWGVDIKINFPRNKEELKALADEEEGSGDGSRDVLEDYDFRLIFAIPAGAGSMDPPPEYNPPEDAFRDSLVNAS